MVPFPSRLGDPDAAPAATLPHRNAQPPAKKSAPTARRQGAQALLSMRPLRYAAEKAATTIRIIQDGRTTLLAGMPKEAAKEALRSGM